MWGPRRPSSGKRAGSLRRTSYEGSSIASRSAHGLSRRPGPFGGGGFILLRLVASTTWILAVTLGLSVILLPRLGLFGVGVGWFAAQASVAALILGRFALNR